MARDQIVTFRVTDEELQQLDERADSLGYDRRAEYCRDSVLGRTRTEHSGDVAALANRVRQLENVIATTTDDHATASGPSTDDYVAGIDLPSTVYREDAHDAVRACVEHLRANGHATKKDLVTAIMPDHALGYDADAALAKIESGDRYRGAWWRRVIKPALTSLDAVEKPEGGRSEWRWGG